MSAKRVRKLVPAAQREKRAIRGTLPMQLQPGDRFTDEEGEWEIVTHPWTTRGGKLVHATVEKPGDASTRRDKHWGAHERPRSGAYDPAR
jgi:hypothetical protein